MKISFRFAANLLIPLKIVPVRVTSKDTTRSIMIDSRIVVMNSGSFLSFDNKYKTSKTCVKPKAIIVNLPKKGKKKKRLRTAI